MFTGAYENPEQYALDREKRHSPLIDCKSYHDSHDPVFAKGYMFWDSVHPTEAVHALLAKDFHDNCFAPNHDFIVPHETLLQQFREAYGARLEKDKARCFGFFSRSYIDYKNASLDIIFNHALHEKGFRTLDMITELGWIHPNKHRRSEHPSIIQAMERVEAQLIPNNSPELADDEVQIEMMTH